MHFPIFASTRGGNEVLQQYLTSLHQLGRESANGPVAALACIAGITNIPVP